MNSLGISTDPTLLSVDLPSSLNTSPSVSTFLPEEEASICPLLPATTPSPPPLDYIHPLTPSTGADSGTVNTESARDCGDDEDRDRANAEDTSSSSSGIGIDVNGGPNSIFTKNAYQHLACNLMDNMNGQDDVKKQNGFRGLHRLNISISQETPRFVAWNWPVIRKCTFFMVISALLAMVALVISMIVTLPKACNPPLVWWKGSVFYEIFPASFQDSNSDGLGDIKGLTSRVDYIKNLGVAAVRLNSIFPAKHYPDHFQNVTSLMEIDDVLGTKQDLQQLIQTLHANNISLVLDLPLYPLITDLAAYDLTDINSTSMNITIDGEDVSHSAKSNLITDAMRLWLSLGVDGFYFKGLERFKDDPYLVDNVKEWRQLLGADRIMIISNNLIKQMDNEAARELLADVDLVDVFLNVTSGSASTAAQIKHTIESVLKPGYGPWIQWSLGGVSERRLANGVSQNASLAASLMQLMLPGTPSIFYGDEINLSETHDPNNEHSETKHVHHLTTMEWPHGNQFTNRETLPWLPRSANSIAFHHVDLIRELISLRERSPSIYMNAVYKESMDPIPSTSVRYSRNDILILERWHPRRNTFVSISNFGDKVLSLDLSAMFYSGEALVTKSQITEIYFSTFEIGPMESTIVKLHK